MKTDKTLTEFKAAMRKAGIKVRTSQYSEFIGVILKTAQGYELNNTVMSKDFYNKHKSEIEFITAYRDTFSVFDGKMRVIF